MASKGGYRGASSNPIPISDSEDDDIREVPAPAARPRKTPIPLPENAHRRVGYSTTAGAQQRAPSTARESLSRTSNASSSRRPSASTHPYASLDIAATTSAARSSTATAPLVAANATPLGSGSIRQYGAVYEYPSKRERESLERLQAAKRRKLSATAAPSHRRTSSNGLARSNLGGPGRPSTFSRPPADDGFGIYRAGSIGKKPDGRANLSSGNGIGGASAADDSSFSLYEDAYGVQDASISNHNQVSGSRAHPDDKAKAFQHAMKRYDGMRQYEKSMAKQGSSMGVPISGQGTNGNADQSRKLPKSWTEEESQDLLRGVAKWDAGNWKRILNDSEYKFSGRTAHDLQDRYRIIGPNPRPKHRPSQVAPVAANTSKKAVPLPTSVRKQRVETQPRNRMFTTKDVPTRGSLNSALKSSGGAFTGDLNDVLASKGRPLRIGRPTNGDPFENAHPAGRELGSSGLDEQAWNGATDETDPWSAHDESGRTTDTDSILQSFNARKSPIKKPVSNAVTPPVSKPEQSSTARPQHVAQEESSFAPKPVPDSDGSDFDSDSDAVVIMSPVQTSVAVHPKSPYPPASTPRPQSARLSQSTPLQKSTPTNTQTNGSPPVRRRFTTEDNLLLIYLKEIKGLSWTEIEPFFPDRTRGTLQTHNCVTVNKRNRKLDPTMSVLEATYNARVAALRNHGAPSVLRNMATPSTQPPQNRVGGLSTQTMSHHRREEPASASTLPSRGRGRPRKVESSASVNPAAGRPRRSVQTVDYNILRMRDRQIHPVETWEEEDEVDSLIPDSRDMSLPLMSPAPEQARPPHEPMDLDFDNEDTKLATSAENKPYLSHAERSLVRNGSADAEWKENSREWQGSVIHVDFNQDELAIVEDAIEKVLGGVDESISVRRRLRLALKDQPEPKLLRLSYEIRRKLRRDRQSVDAFIEDARRGKIPSTPQIHRIAAPRPDRSYSSTCKTSTAALVLQRQLGLQSRRGWKTASTPLSYQLRNSLVDTLGPAFSYTGASSDVHTVAWSPDGQFFAAGTVCVTDEDSMQYNRPNNLLYGNMYDRSIQELPSHSGKRPKTESGPNSTHAMHVSQSEDLFYTVSAVAFSPSGRTMITTGYDQTIIFWQLYDDTNQLMRQPFDQSILTHSAKIDLMTLNKHNQVAIAARRYEKPIKVCTYVEKSNEEGYVLHQLTQTYSSKKANAKMELKMLPTALKFEPMDGRLLLAGFGANKSQDRLDSNGDIGLFDVETGAELTIYGSSKNVFDVAWMPHQLETFGVGCVASGDVNRGTRSTVTLFDGRNIGRHSKFMEVECPALDMNDVVFSPYNETIVAAGCTSGATYVWDLRWPDDILYQLSHGKSLMPLDADQDREVTDTGIRFLSWGDNASRLYTGSSDGVVKVWDVTHSPQDVFVKNLITVDSGIMSGDFTQDKTRLIVGEVNGSISILDVGCDDRTLKDMEKLDYRAWDTTLSPLSQQSAADSDSDHDENAATSIDPFLATGELMVVPAGGFPVRQVVQGPNYSGPFAENCVDAPFLREQALEFQLKLMDDAKKPLCGIPGCADVVTYTSEEIGDSGRSGDRIPDELRRQWLMVDQKPVPGKTKCSKCGRAARPAEDGGGEALCERCGFDCFRCGARCSVSKVTGAVACRDCGGVWDAGALGYECETLKHGSGDEVELKRGIRESVVFEERETAFGDEMNALTEYYLGLGICE